MQSHLLWEDEQSVKPSGARNPALLSTMCRRQQKTDSSVHSQKPRSEAGVVRQQANKPEEWRADPHAVPSFPHSLPADIKQICERAQIVVRLCGIIAQFGGFLA